MIRIGTAGWAIPRAFAGCFAETGSALSRYSGALLAAEINSSFHRPHRPETYARWAETVPEDFRFSAKLPRIITHDKRLVDVNAALATFCEAVGSLGSKLGPLLIQLPPSLAFQAAVATAFLEALRGSTAGAIVCEPRHPSWFQPEADVLLSEHQVARVAADPARVPEAALPGGWPGLRYYRLHGSPRMYYSEYDPDFLADLAGKLMADEAVETWCIFDNTTSGAATSNALTLKAKIPGSGRAAY
jgi:uncharacterized protein YecE (DUF72 family)